MNAAENPNQLALIEPCPICMTLTDIDAWGAGAHRHCRIAAERWYPAEYAQGPAAVAARAAHEVRVTVIAEHLEQTFGPASALLEAATL